VLIVIAIFFALVNVISLILAAKAVDQVTPCPHLTYLLTY
tara:strand:- start:253 stop:372 length:120 start_codon:yes stop_codon:yes gene_type:complete